MKFIESKKIKTFFMDYMESLNIANKISKVVSEALIEASLLGIDSHGVNLFGHYMDCVKHGRINPAGKIEIAKKGVNFICNSNHNFSHYGIRETLIKMNKISEKQGISFASIINSDHVGAVGIHAMNSMIKNKVILGFTNADPLANTPDGKKTVFGTNPISLIFRKSKNEFMYIDLATTRYNMNRIKNHRLNNEALPEGVARDGDFELTTNPKEAKTLEPIGGHKGFVLAFLVEILTSGLMSRDPSFKIKSMYESDISEKRTLTHSFIMIDPKVLVGSSSGVWKVITEVRSQLFKQQKNESPGLKEFRHKQNRLSRGIPVHEEVYSKWIEMGFKK